MSLEDLKKSVEIWKSTVDTNAFSDSVSAFAESAAHASPIIDKASTWAAAGTATVAGLSVVNIDVMAVVYSRSELKWLVSCLAISIFFAILQKYFAVVCMVSLEVSKVIREKLPPILEVFEKHETKIDEMSKEHNLGIKVEYDFEKVLRTYISLYPKWVLFFLEPKFERLLKDRLYGQKMLIHRLMVQNFSAFFQFIAILLFICLAAFFV